MIPSMKEIHAPAPQARLAQICRIAGVVWPSMNLCTANRFTKGITAINAQVVRVGPSFSAIGSLSKEGLLKAGNGDLWGKIRSPRANCKQKNAIFAIRRRLGTRRY